MTATLIFGGTFDPVHFGHLRSALALLDLFDDAQLVMIPCQIPPHRPQPAADEKHRLNMLNLAVEEERSITIDDCELRREGKSFTFDTLRMYRKRWPDAPHYFVLGGDAWVTLTTWYRWQELINFAHLTVLTRPGEPMIESPELKSWAGPITAELDAISAKAGNVVRLTLKPIEMSATAVRTALAEGRSVADCVPNNVINYIQANRLYRKSHDGT